MKTFIFDLDDTLIYNQYRYVKPQIKLAKYILEKTGRCPEDIKILKGILSLKREEVLYETIDSVAEKYKLKEARKILQDLTDHDIMMIEKMIALGENPFDKGRIQKSFEVMLDKYCKERKNKCLATQRKYSL